MRVLVVASWFPSARDPGNGIFILRDVEMLASNHTVTVVHLLSPQAFEAEPNKKFAISQNLRVLRIRFDYQDPVTIRSAAALIRQLSQEHDLVHSMAFSALIPLLLARQNLPWVHTEHWSGLMGPPTSAKARMGSKVLPVRSRIRLGRTLLFPGLRKPDEVVAVSKALAGAIKKFRKNHVEVIPNSVEVRALGQLPETPEDRGDSPLRIVAVGSLIPHKGPLELIEAISVLNGSGFQVDLKWAGVGPLKEAVISRAQDLGIADQVHLLGHVNREEIPGLLQGAHLFALLTRSETYGVAIAEALAAGLPVVTSGYGGHIEFLPKEASNIISSRETDRIATAIIELANRSQRWSADQIRSYAKCHFSEDHRRQQYENVYARAVSRK